MTNMTGDTKARLFKVVNKQFKMVKSLNRANEAHAAELERVRREKDDVERKYKTMKKHAVVMGDGQQSGVGDDLTVATPYTVGTELHDYGANGGRGTQGGNVRQQRSRSEGDVRQRRTIGHRSVH